MATTMIGSVVASSLVLQQASAVIICKQDFVKLSEKFQQDILNLKSSSLPDMNRQLAMLFDNYEQATTKLIENETTTK